MKRDTIRFYIIEILLFIVLCLALFVSNRFDRKILALVLIVFAIFTRSFVKKKNMISNYAKQVTWLMIGFAVVYLISFYLMGLYFGYYESSSKFSLFTIWNFIIPLSAIVISSELIRDRLLSKKNKFSKIMIFIDMVLVDLIVYTGVYDYKNLDDALAIVGFIFFASVACNLLYNYISARFGRKSIIAYRLITILYMYFIPYVPDVYIFFRSFLRMIYPYLIYLVLEYTYSKANNVSSYKDRTKNVIGTFVVMVLMSLIIALVSCKFEFGILVIGSGSMTGSIDRGDAVIYRQYHNGVIKEGDVVIFYNGEIKTVHRVTRIENVNGEYRFYTKGDANLRADNGYRNKKDIIGITKMNIKYIGYPTLWLRDIFESD